MKGLLRESYMVVLVGAGRVIVVAGKEIVVVAAVLLLL
jgi:hypothetical protein